jgi:hypothetical protein
MSILSKSRSKSGSETRRVDWRAVVPDGDPNARYCATAPGSPANPRRVDLARLGHLKPKLRYFMAKSYFLDGPKRWPAGALKEKNVPNQWVNCFSDIKKMLGLSEPVVIAKKS